MSQFAYSFAKKSYPADLLLWQIVLKVAALVIFLFLLLAIPFHSSAQSSTNSFNMQVYSDGSAALTQSVSVNASDISVTISLLSPIITNVIATDQNGSPLSFQISGDNISVYTIGATSVTIRYDTDSLTSKQGSVWTLAFATPYNLTVTLPAQSSLSSVTGTPVSISEQNGSPVLVLLPGKWSVSYGVPIEAGSSTTTSASSQSHSGSTSSSSTISSSPSVSNPTTSSTSFTSNIKSQTASSNSVLFEFGALAAVLVVGGVGGLFLYRRRYSTIEGQATELRPDDVQVLNYIGEKGGKVFEQEIRSRFTLPKTSAWRQIKRLERLGYLKVYKVGSQNQIELLRKKE